MLLCELASLILATGCWMGNPDVPKDPARAGSYRATGLSLRAQARLPEAIAAFQKANQLDPTHLAGILLGWTQHLTG